MVGKRNYFMTLIQNDSSNVIKIQCICHSSALIASKACMNLPRTVEQLMRSIYSYVSGSSKRCAQLFEVQEYFGDQRKKLLKLADTRWLAMHQCIIRVLECWNSLISYFRVAVIEDKLKSAQTIMDNLLNPFNKCYFLFLNYALNYLNSFNALFQSRQIMIHKMFDLSLSLMKTLCQNFIKPALLNNNISNLNFKDTNNLLTICELFVGAECQELLNSQSEENVKKFKEKCQNFYITTDEEIIQRLPVNDNFFKEMKFLDPEIAPNSTNRTDLMDLPLLKNYFDIFKLTEEWRQLPFSLTNSQIEHLKNLGDVNIADMWDEISILKNLVNDTPCFPNLSMLAKLILTLPHSNAEAERVFSIVNDVKTKKNVIALVMIHLIQSQLLDHHFKTKTKRVLTLR